MSTEAEKYYHSKKWGNPHWDRKTATMFAKSEMFDFAESYHQHRLSQILSELTDEKIEGMVDSLFIQTPDRNSDRFNRMWMREGAKAIREFIKGKQLRITYLNQGSPKAK